MMNVIRRIQNRLTEFTGIFNRLVRVGVVFEVDAKTNRVRVTLLGLNDMPSGWLQVVTARSLGVQTRYTHKVGERVLCVFVPISDM